MVRGTYTLLLQFHRWLVRAGRQGGFRGGGWKDQLVFGYSGCDLRRQTYIWWRFALFWLDGKGKKRRHQQLSLDALPVSRMAGLMTSSFRLPSPTCPLANAEALPFAKATRRRFLSLFFFLQSLRSVFVEVRYYSNVINSRFYRPGRCCRLVAVSFVCSENWCFRNEWLPLWVISGCQNSLGQCLPCVWILQFSHNQIKEDPFWFKVCQTIEAASSVAYGDMA